MAEVILVQLEFSDKIFHALINTHLNDRYNMLIQLMQWNIWYKEKPENIFNFLKKADADIICAQELIKDSGVNLDGAKYIAKTLGFEYYHHDSFLYVSYIAETAHQKPEGFQKLALNRHKRHGAGLGPCPTTDFANHFFASYYLD